MPAKKKSAPRPGLEEYAETQTASAPAGHEEAPAETVREDAPGVAETGTLNAAPAAGLTAEDAYARLPDSTRRILETEFRARLLGLRQIPPERLR